MDELILKCEEKSASEPLYGEMIKLFKLEDHKEYLKKTREVIQRIKSDEELKKCQIILQCLSQLFFTKSVDIKGVVRRLLASFFNSLPEDSKTFLSVIFQGCILSKTITNINQDTPSSNVRQNVDILASLLENFPFGENCVVAAVVPYTNFLVKAHQYFLEKTESATSPLLLNEAMHHCLVTEQLVNRMIQKCFIPLQTKLTVNSEDIEGTFLKLLVTNVKILLKMEDILMDCRCNAAITLTLILIFCCPDDVSLIFVSIIRNEDITCQVPVWLTSGIECVKESKLSIPSYLCLLFGSLSMLKVEHLAFKLQKDSFLLTELFLPEIMKLVQLVDNPASKVILSKLINLWTEKALNLLNEPELNVSLKMKLKGEGETVQSILSYVWSSVDDSLDAVRQNARIAFDQILKTHLKLTTNEKDPWLVKLIEDVLNVPWCKRGKYAPLICLVENIGASRLLEHCPEITSLVIEQLADHTLACYCSEFYEKMYTSHKLELPSNKAKEWFTIWVNPVIEALCLNSKSTKNHILQYLLPKIMSFNNDILQYMIGYLSRKDTQSSGTLGALIMCLRRGRSLGLLDDQKSNRTMWCGIIHMEVLKYALCSLDEQIRLDAFSLMCENKKTSKPIKPLEFKLVKLFIPNNLNNQSPSFRQHLGAYAKKLFNRIKESQNSLLNQKEKCRRSEEISEFEAHLFEYKEFLQWLRDHLFSCLYPAAAFAMRTSCLKMMTCMIEVLHPPTNKQSFAFFDDLNSSHIYSILECIADTFEENKIEALKIFTEYIKCSKSPVFEYLQLKELLHTCVELSVSTKPQDSTTSAYLARCLLQVENIQDVMNNYTLNLKVLRNKPQINTSSEPNSRYLHFAEFLLLSLQDQTEFAKKGLVLAAANRPIYPTIHCARYVLGDIDLKSCGGSSAWKEYFSKLVKVCLEVADIVSPVVQDSSPEGNVPDEAIRGPGLDYFSMAQSEEDKNLMLEAEKSEKTVTLMPEYLVVCCWRSIKEVSLLLGEIFLRSSIQDESEKQDGVLSYDQIIEMGNYFITQLLQSKHRGAFELAYAGFIMMCGRLWKSPLEKLNKLPLEWLDKVLEDIGTDDETTGLCSTRRSAGIPFYVQALLGTEPEVNEHKAFQRTMSILLKLAFIESSPCTTNNPPRVHALNILKVLFKDNKLGDFVSPFISEGLMAAIHGFKSKFWSVRNSATLLLSSLMIRIFGVKVTKDDSDLSRKNCLTGRAFFQRFPNLYGFLLEEFQAATENLSSPDGIHLHPSLYPVLMVLGRLYPSAMEGTDTNLNLAAFIPLVIKCSSSAVYKTRVMAARAIQPLVEKDRITATIIDLVKRLPCSDEPKSYNLIHGILIQIKFLLNSVEELNTTIKMSVTNHVSHSFERVIWLLSDENKCPMVVEVAFEICHCLLSLIPEKAITSSLYPIFVQHLKSAVNRPVTRYPGSVKSQSTISKLTFRHVDSECYAMVAVNLLQSNSYEVRLSVLEDILQNIESINDTDRILDKLLGLALHSEWHFECLSRVFDVLCLIPNCVRQIHEGVLSEIFTICLEKLENEGRDEVKCSILKFTSKFIEYLYTNDCSQNRHLLNKWYQTLKDHSSTEQDGDLQLTVAQAILDNTKILLCDPKSVLKDLCQEFWVIVFDLLQEDDLDVKDVVSKVYSKLNPYSQGEIQPGHSLNLLLEKFVEIHVPNRPEAVVKTLLNMLEGAEEGEIEDERLFDKGEMNTYRDEIFFTRLVSHCLLKTLQEYLLSNGEKQTLVVLFEKTSKTFLQRLKKYAPLTITDSFTNSNNHSKTITEICRASLFLQCCDKINTKSEDINELRILLKSFIDKSVINNCVTTCFIRINS